MTPLDHEAIRNALQYALTRSARICYNLNSETHGHERGPDCARKIEAQTSSIIDEAMAVSGITPKACRETEAIIRHNQGCDLFRPTDFAIEGEEFYLPRNCNCAALASYPSFTKNE